MSELLHWIYRTWRILLNLLSWILTLALLVVTLSLLAFQLRPVKQLLLNMALNQVNTSIQGEVTARELSGFIPFSIQVYDLALYPEKVEMDSSFERLQAPIVDVPELRVQLDLYDLLSGTVSFRSFRAIKPEIQTLWDLDTRSLSLSNALSNNSLKSASGSSQALYIPEFSIENGSLTVIRQNWIESLEGLKDSIRVEQIFTTLFFESREDRRILDLTELYASLPTYGSNTVQITGQFFQDVATTELNGFRIKTLGSELNVSGSINVGLHESFVQIQTNEGLNQRDFELKIDRTLLDFPELASFGMPIPIEELPDKVELKIQLSNREGITYLDDLELYSGNSYANVEGRLNLDKWDQDLLFSLTSAQMDPHDFPVGSFLQKFGSVVPELLIEGEIKTDPSLRRSEKNGFIVQFNANQRDFQKKKVAITSKLLTEDQWDSYQIDLQLLVDSLNWELSPLLTKSIPLQPGLADSPTLWQEIRSELSETSLISGNIVVSLEVLEGKLGLREITGNLSDNSIGKLNLGGLSFNASTREDTLDYEVDSGSQFYQISSKGSILTRELGAPYFFSWWDSETRNKAQELYQAGWQQITTITNLQLSELLPSVFEEKTDFSLLFQHDVQVGFPEYGSGTLRIVAQDITLEGQEVEDLTVMISLEQTTNSNSTFSLVSNIARVDFQGKLSPLSLPKSIRQIAQTISEKVEEQTFGLVNLPADLTSDSGEPNSKQSELLNGDFQIIIDDLDPVGHLLRTTPFTSNFQTDGSIHLTPTKLSVEGDFQDTLFTSSFLLASNLLGSFELLYYPDNELTSENKVLFEASSDSLSGNFGQMKNVKTSLSFLRENLAFTINSDRDPQHLHLQMSSVLELQQDELALNLLSLKAGKGDYEWLLSQPSSISYSRGDVVSFRTLKLDNQEQSFQLDGTFSQAPGDSIRLAIEGLNLGEISEFLPGRLMFDGMVNASMRGTFPGGIPIVFGQMNADQLELNERPVGDFSLSSVYEPETEQFNLNARLFSSLAVLETVNGQQEQVGQDFTITGYVRNPTSTTLNLPKFDIQAEFNRIDLWILEELLPNLIIGSRGVATGWARLIDPVGEGQGARPLLEGEADIVNAEVSPLFLNTRYAITGQLSYSNRSGFQFSPLLLRDPFGGEATLTGVVGLTSLDEPIPLTLSLQMNRFQFINNPYDPDLPFYATVNGTGNLQLTGNSQNPVLRTPNPILVTSNSRVSVPLLDVINVSQDTKFITFVEDFENWSSGDPASIERRRTPGSTTSSAQESEFSFTDQFTMDLQFVAQEPIRFEMIFDRLTNEAIYGNGTGQMRLTLQDGNYQLFGGVDLSSGEYNFVSGDILTRRFQLEEGGRVVWDGNPTNAQLNVQAVYRARPPLSTLGVVSASSADQLGTGQRIPIELVLQIFGSMDQIQNEFFFRMPTGIAGFSDPTLATRISSLNRNQEEKLVQAFSILLTGNFIPSGESTFENTSVLSGLTGSAVLINPFVSTQLLSPLLSNQINSLLNENVTFDVDVNIDAYNEVELAVALRLYNDRLVLRREGQITGDQNRIGDLGATYRINRILSLTAFHRQDPTFTSSTGQTSGDGGDNQVINGVGVEARFQFHTWKEFFRRLTAWMRRDEPTEVAMVEITNAEAS